ncbi:MAG TPA: DUF308 domain-containing protein [Candidatus Saccharibacteria bacterium]|nr:DUF308 domain-containing protein [Candidatus Saccharibacteria bacterium]HMT39402.1 DUF308 domain-containing protein [Candidatus Saccharibacteria bacterium]
MELLLTPSRSALAWRGLSNALLGIILLAWPQITVYVVILFFSLNLIIVGLYSVIEPLFNKRNPHAIMSIALGILGVTFGVYLIIRPEFAAGLVGLLLSFWALLFGIFDISVSVKALKLKLHFAWVYLLIGIVSVLFGLFMLLNPVSGVLTIVWLFGLYAMIIGITLLLMGILMRPVSIKAKSGVKK